MQENFKSGRHFLQIPGPTNVPDRVLRAIDRPTIDHRGPEFARLAFRLFDKMRPVFKTDDPILIYPSSGSGMWEASLVNTMSAGDRVLMFETGHFAMQWSRIAEKLGIEVELVPGDWRRGVNAMDVEERLENDTDQKIKAVAVVHNETSTGAVSDIQAVRKAIDAAGHPALLFVDTISSLGSLDYRHDDWGVDVTVAGSQKGLMLPPGLGFNAVSSKAFEAAKSATLPNSYWDWEQCRNINEKGFFPYTPATNLLFGLEDALDMLMEEGLDTVFARHERFAKATQAAVKGWGLEMQCVNQGEWSNALTTVRVPEGTDADALRKVILEKYDMSLGTGLGKVKGKVFRIGHLGYFNDLTLMGTLCGVEMGLERAGIPHRKGGVQAAMEVLSS